MSQSGAVTVEVCGSALTRDNFNRWVDAVGARFMSFDVDGATVRLHFQKLQPGIVCDPPRPIAPTATIHDIGGEGG